MTAGPVLGEADGLGMTRTHLNNTSARDMGQFLQNQGARTPGLRSRSCFGGVGKVYPRHSREEATPVLRKLAISHMGCGDFLLPLRCAFVGVAQATPSSARLAQRRKSLATRAGGIFEMGSKTTQAAYERTAQ